MGEAITEPKSQLSQQLPGSQHSLQPTGPPYLDSPEAEAIEQCSSQQAAGEAEDCGERARSGCKVRNHS